MFNYATSPFYGAHGSSLIKNQCYCGQVTRRPELCKGYQGEGWFGSSFSWLLRARPPRKRDSVEKEKKQYQDQGWSYRIKQTEPLFVFQVALKIFSQNSAPTSFPRNTFKRSLSKNYHWCIKSFTGKTYTSWIEAGKAPNFRLFSLWKKRERRS